MTAPASTPATRAALALGFIVAVTLTPASRPAWLAAEGAALLIVIVLSRVSLAGVLRRLLVLSPFVAGVALAAALGGRGADWRILAARSGLCLAAVVALSRTTTFAEMLAVFRAARVPSLLVTTLALMNRYLFVLGDESARMGRARAARTFTRTRRWDWMAASSVVGRLFVRASERAERIYDAMCARGWKS